VDGVKFDNDKAAWHLIPSEHLVSMAVAIRPFIETHMLSDKEIHFNRNYIYSIAKSNIIRWHHKGECSYLGNFHPLTNAMIGICMLAKPRVYTHEEVFSTAFNQRWDLIDPEWTRNIAQIYQYGAVKYEADNWKKVEPYRYYSALNRHIDEYWAGNKYDSESGFHHLYHAAWNCIALQWFDKNNVSTEIKSTIPPEILKASRKLKNITLISMPKKITKKKDK